MRAGWVVDEGSWSPEWEPTEGELHDLAEKAMADELLHRFRNVLVIHAPGRLAMLASDRPLPHGDPRTAMSALPRQPITEAPPPSWWPDGTGRPTSRLLTPFRSTKSRKMPPMISSWLLNVRTDRSLSRCP